MFGTRKNKEENSHQSIEKRQKSLVSPSKTEHSKTITTKNVNTMNTTNENNVIGEGTKIEGTISSTGNITIEGNVIGTISSDGKLTVTNTGSIEGDIFCQDADFDGSVSGNVKAKGKVTIKPKAFVKGDVRYGDIQIEPGAHIACTISRLNTEKEAEKLKRSAETKIENIAVKKPDNKVSSTTNNISKREIEKV